MRLVQTLEGKHESVDLENNAGVLYRGTKLVHWRQARRATYLPTGNNRLACSQPYIPRPVVRPGSAWPG